MMKSIVYGVGKRLGDIISRLDLRDIICFADKRYQEYEKEIYGKRVVGPKEISLYNYDLILVSSNLFFDEITGELVVKYQVPVYKIISADYYIGAYPRGYIVKKMSQIYNEILRYEYRKYDVSAAGKYYDSFLEERLKSVGVEKLSPVELEECYYMRDDVAVIKGVLWRIKSQGKKLMIYVVSHKEYTELNDSVYQTIWVGDRFCENAFFSSLDNINDFNSRINECTALYSIWKHDNQSEYIGLNHYRRFFRSILNPGLPVQKWEILLMMKKCDVIVAQANFYNMSIKEQLALNINAAAYTAGVNALNKAFDSRSEKERKILDQFMEENMMFPYQMFIMRRELLVEYCEWLFPILFEMIDYVTIEDEWDAYSKRIIAFIAERLFTVWLLITEYRIEELPVIQTDKSGPYGWEK